jgi:dynein heavy chain
LVLISLVKHQETGELFVNFDSQIMELIQESKCLAALNLEIPVTAKNLMVKEEEIKTNHVS